MMWARLAGAGLNVPARGGRSTGASAGWAGYSLVVFGGCRLRRNNSTPATTSRAVKAPPTLTYTHREDRPLSLDGAGLTITDVAVGWPLITSPTPLVVWYPVEAIVQEYVPF